MSANIKIQASDVMVLIAYYGQATANTANAILKGENLPPEVLIGNIRRTNEMAEALLAFIAAEQERSRAQDGGSPASESQPQALHSPEDKALESAQ